MFDAIASAARILVLTVDVDVVVIGGGISALGQPLLDGVHDVFTGWETTSPFIASLQLSDRVRMLPKGTSSAATGAAWLGSIPWAR
jgi:glucokinase